MDLLDYFLIDNEINRLEKDFYKPLQDQLILVEANEYLKADEDYIFLSQYWSECE